MTLKVFVSYAQKDEKIARELTNSLKEAGAKVLSADPKSTELIASDVTRKLRESDEVIVLLTNESTKSEWVLFELGAAAGMHKPVTVITHGPKTKLMSDFHDWKRVAYSNVGDYVGALRDRIGGKPR